MTKFPLIATLMFAVAAPAMAATPAKERVSFTHDGVTYNYTQTRVGDSLVIQGHAENGPNFYYVVRNGQVVGKNDGSAVSFRVADAVATRRSVEVSSSR